MVSDLSQKKTNKTGVKSVYLKSGKATKKGYMLGKFKETYFSDVCRMRSRRIE